MAAIKETNFNFPGQTNFYKGKVRDVYTIDNQVMAMVVTDRISAFDVVLPEAIPFKGQVLNQIAAKFLSATKDIVPNWVIAVPDPVVTIGRYCQAKSHLQRNTQGPHLIYIAFVKQFYQYA